MHVHTIERALVALAAALLLIAAVRWRSAVPSTMPASTSIAAVRAGDDPASDSALADAEDLTVANDPFRLSNTPPDARFDPAGDAAQASRGFTPPPLRPSFVLKAIVGGPPWQAVVDGIPGQPPGTVTRQGTQYDKLVVRAVTRDSVIIQGPDTSWVLRFGRQP